MLSAELCENKKAIKWFLCCDLLFEVTAKAMHTSHDNTEGIQVCVTQRCAEYQLHMYGYMVTNVFKVLVEGNALVYLAQQPSFGIRLALFGKKKRSISTILKGNTCKDTVLLSKREI